MNDVFLLGAGFSIAVDPHNMPTTNKLGERVLEVLKSSHGSGIPKHTAICDGLSCDRPLLIPGGWPAPDFEAWLSVLAEPQPFLSAAENERRHALYRDLTDLVASQIERATQSAFNEEPPTWLTGLAKRWMADEAHIITLNYDTFVETAVDYAIFGPQEPQRYYDVPLRPNLIPRQPTGSIDGGNARTGPRPTLSLWKLHGSIRWYWDDLTHSAESMVDLGQFLRWRCPPEQAPQEGRAPGKVPVIVPPTTSKSGFFTNGVIRQFWRRAFEALRIAERVFIIGYSLPPADLLVRSLVGEALQVTVPKVWLVNTDPAVIDRSAGLGFPLVTDYCKPGQPVGEFAEWYLSEADQPAPS